LFAKRPNYPWFRKLDAADYDLGSGKRVVAKGGKLDNHVAGMAGVRFKHILCPIERLWAEFHIVVEVLLWIVSFGVCKYTLDACQPMSFAGVCMHDIGCIEVHMNPVKHVVKW
jgi:hypothetical protein